MEGSFGASPLESLAREAMLQGLVYMDEFTYSAAWITGTTTALGASATVDVQVQINSDSDFIAQQYNLTAWTALDTILVSPDYLITLIRSGSGRELMNQAQHVANFAGNYRSASSNFPGDMPISSLYQGNGSVTVRLQNRTVTAANRVDFALRGFKVFYQTNAQGQTGNRQMIFGAL
jgi:hypothetical protein